MLDAKPSDPTITTSLGFEISLEILSAGKTREARKSSTWHFKEAFKSFQRYGEAKSEKEHAVDEGSENLGAMPPVGVT